MRVTTALNFRIIDGELYTLPNDFETAAPQTILKWALDEFGSDVALATGFGTEGCILVDMVARIDPSARIFYLDTDLLFPETYELRDRLVPINRKHPLSSLMDACRRYLERAPRDFITFEYVMLDGVNDQPEHARELIELVRDVPCKLNLIPFNPFPGSGFETSPRERIRSFAKRLQDAGIVATIRKTRGDDIAAACGQLAGQVQDRTKRRLATRIPLSVAR